MRLIAIDSSGLVASVALMTDDILTGEYTIHNKKTHSQTLLPMLSDMLEMAEVTMEEVDVIAVASGPGSFTGLRIGAATAKGLAGAKDIPVVAIPTLQGLAYNVCPTDAMICPLMDARRQQAYYGIYQCKDGMPIACEADGAYPILDIIQQLNELGQRVIFLGDGVPVFRETIEAEIKVPYEFAPVKDNYQRAASIAELGRKAFSEGKCMEAREFAPNYLRLSQAERLRRTED